MMPMPMMMMMMMMMMMPPRSAEAHSQSLNPRCPDSKGNRPTIFLLPPGPMELSTRREVSASVRMYDVGHDDLLVPVMMAPVSRLRRRFRRWIKSIKCWSWSEQYWRQ